MGKNAFLIILAILLVGGSFAFAEYKNSKEEIVYVAPDVTETEISIDGQNLDTDGDGLKDWEEILLGTNPKDPKSKTSAASQTSTIKDLTQKTEDLSPIDIVSREFFARYMELRQLGFANDKLNQLDLVEKTISGITLSQPGLYTEKDILVKTDTSNEGVRIYANEIGNIFRTLSIKSRNEGIIAKEAVEREDPELLKEIDPIITSYKNMVNALLKVRAPQSMSKIHLDVVNGMNGLLFIAQSFRNSGTDPVLGLQAVAYHQVAEANMIDALNAVKSYLTYLGIYENIF